MGGLRRCYVSVLRMPFLPGWRERAINRARHRMACLPLIYDVGWVADEGRADLARDRRIVARAARWGRRYPAAARTLAEADHEIRQWLNLWPVRATSPDNTNDLIFAAYHTLQARLHHLERQLSAAMNWPSITDINQLPPDIQALIGRDDVDS